MRAPLGTITVSLLAWKGFGGGDSGGESRRTKQATAETFWPPPSVSDTFLSDLTIQNNQVLALRDLYESTNASQSPSFNDWFRPDDDPLHAHYCYWNGVTCDNERYVIHLDLNETGLAGTIPDSIRSFTRLRRLKVWKNSHIGEIPRVIGQLTELTSLILGQNNFMGSIPEELGYSYRLRRLLLQSNDITGTIPSTLCQLSELRALDLSGNDQLVGPLPSCLGQLSHLRHLRIRKSGLTGQVPAALCELSMYGCDGIACAAGSYQFPDGRQSTNSTSCIPCLDSSPVIGRIRCETDMGDDFDLPLPSMSPSMVPSEWVYPSASPTKTESGSPSVGPTFDATSMSPSASPTSIPTFGSSYPSSIPSTLPSTLMPSASLSPTVYTLEGLTDLESESPSQSHIPTDQPTSGPSNTQPSFVPSPLPSSSPKDSDNSIPTSTQLPYEWSDLSTPSPSDPSPTIKPTVTPFPSSGFVIGRAQGDDYSEVASKDWTWGVFSGIMLFAVCCLAGLAILARRRRRESSITDASVECLPDLDDQFPPNASPVPVDPFSFPERDIENSGQPETSPPALPHITCIEYHDAATGRTSGIINVSAEPSHGSDRVTNRPPENDIPLESPLRKSGAVQQREFKMQVKAEGVEFVSETAPVKSRLSERETVSLFSPESTTRPKSGARKPIIKLPPPPSSVRRTRKEVAASKSLHNHCDDMPTATRDKPFLSTLPESRSFETVDLSLDSSESTSVASNLTSQPQRWRWFPVSSCHS